MHHLQAHFEDFLNKISPTEQQREEMDAVHAAVIQSLRQDKLLKHIWVKSFVQGSYRRDTGLIGTEGHPCDIDVVVVTKLPDVLLPAFALDLFDQPLAGFCERKKEEGTKGRYCHALQGRSWGISVSPTINLDIVPTSSVDDAWTKPLVDAEHTSILLTKASAASRPSMLGLMEEGFSFRAARKGMPLIEGVPGGPPIDQLSAKAIDAFLAQRKQAAAELEKQAPAGPLPMEVNFPGALRIPDHKSEHWVATHPLAQIAWTQEKNSRCNGHFTKVVRCLKWWKRERVTDCAKPKGYPLERLVGECCPDGIASVAEGLAKTFAAIIEKYASRIERGEIPKIPDHGTTADVWKRLDINNLRKFIANVRRANALAQRAMETGDKGEAERCWHELFGREFPEPAPKVPAVPASPVPTQFTGSDGAKQPTKPKTFG